MECEITELNVHVPTKARNRIIDMRCYDAGIKFDGLAEAQFAGKCNIVF